MALTYRGNNNISYAVLASNPGAYLQEKHLHFKNAAGTTQDAYFERDDWPTISECVPPSGSQLKFNDGTHSYRALLSGTRNRGNFSASISGSFSNLDSGTYADWTEIASIAAASIDRRSRWTDRAYNFVYQAGATILFGQSLWIKVVLSYTRNNDVATTITLAPSYNPLWPAAYDRSWFDSGTCGLIYPKPGTTVEVKLYAKGGLGATNNFYFSWLTP